MSDSRLSIRDTLDQALRSDDTLVLVGREIGIGEHDPFSVSGLFKSYGPERVLNFSLDPGALIATAVGIALEGRRVVLHLRARELLERGYLALLSELAELPLRSEGRDRARIIIRLGIDPGRFCPEVLFAAIPGVRVAVPAALEDACKLIEVGLTIDEPLVILEPMPLQARERPRLSPLPGLIDRAHYERRGKDITLISFGSVLDRAVQAADLLRAKGIECDVINLLFLSPIDTDAILQSFQKTGRILIVQDSPLSFGIGAEIAALVAERGTDYIQGPIRRLGALDAPALERFSDDVKPSVDRIVSTVQEWFNYERGE